MSLEEMLIDQERGERQLRCEPWQRRTPTLSRCHRCERCRANAKCLQMGEASASATLSRKSSREHDDGADAEARGILEPDVHDAGPLARRVLARRQLEVFFEGLSEARAHLDRDRQDPDLILERLRIMVGDLSRPRRADELARWLVKETRKALVAASTALWVRTGNEWRLLCSEGVVSDSDDACAEALKAGLLISPGNAEPPSPVTVLSGDRFIQWLPADGGSGAVGALYVEGAPALDGVGRQLLSALCEMTAAMLE